MKIFSTTQIREWDQYTILHEPVSSIDLMERAAQCCTNWIKEKYDKSRAVKIFCGPGNNGGDGFAIARQLHQSGYLVDIYELNTLNKRSSDNTTNAERLHSISVPFHSLSEKSDFPKWEKGDIIIDALFGSGLNRRVDGIAAILINYINHSTLPVISIDIPSGLFNDQPSDTDFVIRATTTLSFQSPKLCFLIPENEMFVGQWEILDIGLSTGYYHKTDSPLSFVKKDDIKLLIKRRSNFGHKGSYGHAALIAGSYGMLGAAMLAGKACLRSGVGKLTVFCTPDSYPILQSVIPEAIYTISDPSNYNDFIKDEFKSVGIGPGIGVGPSQKLVLSQLFEKKLPLILDADALNNLAEDSVLMQNIPPGSILTPHLKEFERLFGYSKNGFERIEKSLHYAKQHGIFIIVKGHFSYLATPDGKICFNSTGNPGMATAGSGDVLTGMITGLLAQGYSALESSIIGMWLHGKAGDIAAARLSQESMVASDIVHCIPHSFRKIV